MGWPLDLRGGLPLPVKSHVGSPLLVDLQSAARILGLTPSSVRGLVLRKQLPSIRAGRGGKIFISRAAIDNYISALSVCADAVKGEKQNEHKPKQED